MDRINFVDGFFPSQVHFNGLQDAIEGADRRLARSVVGKGIITGFDVSIDGETVTVSPGLAFDADGRTVRSDDPLTVDLSAVQRPGSGQFRWVALYVAFARNNYGDVYDDNNQRHDLYRDEIAVGGYVTGGAGSAEGASRPSVGSHVLVADILIDSGSAMDSFPVNSGRRITIPSLVGLLGRTVVRRVYIDGDSQKVILFSELGLSDGNYSVQAQLAGDNTRFIRSHAVQVTQSGITVRLYHDSHPYGVPVLGSPIIKVGTKTIGDFIIGDRENISVDLFIRKEDMI